MFMCHICYKNFPDFLLLTNHLQSDHCSQCIVCSIVFIANTDHGVSMCPKCCQAEKNGINTTVEVKCEQNPFSSDDVSEVSVSVPVNHQPGCSGSSSTVPEILETIPRNSSSTTNHCAHGTQAVPAHRTEPVLAHGTEPVLAHGTEAVLAHRTEPVPAHGTGAVLAHRTEAVPAHGTEAVPLKYEDVDVSALIRSIPQENLYPPYHNHPASINCSHGNPINSSDGQVGLSSGLVIYNCESLEVLPVYPGVGHGEGKDLTSRQMSEVKVDRKDNPSFSQMSEVDAEHESPGTSNYIACTGQRAKTRAEIQKAYRERKKLEDGDKYLEKERLRQYHIRGHFRGQRARSKIRAETPKNYQKRKKANIGGKKRQRSQKGKTRAEIQKAYRERKIQIDGEEYREKERQRSKQNYVPNSQLNHFEKLERNARSREHLRKYRERKKAANELVKQEDTDSFEEENSGYKSRKSTGYKAKKLLIVRLPAAANAKRHVLMCNTSCALSDV